MWAREQVAKADNRPLGRCQNRLVRLCAIQAHQLPLANSYSNGPNSVVKRDFRTKWGIWGRRRHGIQARNKGSHAIPHLSNRCCPCLGLPAEFLEPRANSDSRLPGKEQP